MRIFHFHMLVNGVREHCIIRALSAGTARIMLGKELGIEWLDAEETFMHPKRIIAKYDTPADVIVYEHVNIVIDN